MPVKRERRLKVGASLANKPVSFFGRVVAVLFVGVLVFCVGTRATLAEPVRIAFINVSKPAAFWSRVAETMRDAASDLGIDLTILESGGDQQKMISLARTLGQQAVKPDALVVVNERQAGGPMIEAAARANIPVFLIFSGFSGKDAAYYGVPRQKIPLWIGSLRPSHEGAGYAIARELIRQGKARFGDQIRLIAIGGNRATPAATAREAGLNRAIREAGGVELVEIERAEWRRDMARAHTRRLLRLNQGVRLIWTANDDMALGVTDAVAAAALTPGEDVLIGGLNWSRIGLANVRDGKWAVDAGGHYMGGAWALVALFDYFHGRDFAEEDTELVFQMGTFHSGNLPRDSALKFKNVDFRRFSKVLNPKVVRYRFDIDSVVDDIIEHRVR
jgi:ABC-type sugar transport system substrate-binding protein